jgi:hypothetical protein
MHRDADRRGELLGEDRRLGVALVGEDRDDARGLHQPLRVRDGVGLHGRIPRGGDGLARRLAAEVRRQPPPKREGVHRGIRERVGDGPQLCAHLGRGQERLTEEHRARVEPLGFLLHEVHEPVRVGVRIDDPDAGEIDLGHQYLHR